jgi:hypothetical protein
MKKAELSTVALLILILLGFVVLAIIYGRIFGWG